MAPRLKIKSFLSLFLIIPMLMLSFLGACSKSKKTGVDAAGAAPIQSTSDASAAGTEGEDEDRTTSLEDCPKDEEATADGEEAEDSEEAEGKGAAKEKKGKGQPVEEVKKECPAPTAGTGTTPATGTASLAEGQKIYNANCQGCHGALPGEKQGTSATNILSAASVGAHKGVTPWPMARASSLSAQDAAASLAAAMK